MSERRFPIQGGLTISWPAAEEAYHGYSRLYGTSQSLDRLAERGGFGLMEFICLVYAGRADSIGLARDIVRGRPSDAHYVEVLAAADVHSASADQETQRQLAQVTAERDSLRESLAERRKQVELLAYELRKWQTGEYLDSRLQDERDALKRRVEELEAAQYLDERLHLLSEKTELERMLAEVHEEAAIDRASLTARLRVVESRIAKTATERLAAQETPGS